MGLVRASSSSRLGSYELGGRLGTGGMAEVYVGWRAGPHGFNKRFAIKVILPQLARDPRFVAMFCDEARISAALTHPNIVQVHDFGENDGELFMAMEYVDGVSCAKLLRSVAARGERFPLGAALFIAHEVLRALSFAHEACDEQGRLLGIVHRDVSPGNILIGRAGEIKLTDFGIVRGSFIDRRTYPGELKGKMGYMSPEQVIGAEVDPRSDLFTIGIVLAELLLCRPLFPGRNELDILSRIYEADIRVLERFGADLLPELLAMLRVALARDPAARFQTARDFNDALRAVARRAGVALMDTELVPWLSSLGILASKSGTREAISFHVKPRARAASERAGQSRSSDELPADRASRLRSEPPRPIIKARLSPSPSFHLRARTGGLIGPLTLVQMLGLIATGRVDTNVLVSDDGAAFRPIRAIDSLATLALRPAFKFSALSADRVKWQLPVERASLPATLFQFAVRGETGLCVFKDGRRQKRLYLNKGVPCFIASTEQSELLGSRLVQANLLSRQDVEAALMLAAEGGQQRLGEVLVLRGLLRPTSLLRALIEQLEQRFVELGSWGKGELCFVRGEQSGEDQLKPQASKYSLITRAVREGYTDAEIAGLLARLRAKPLLRIDAAPIRSAELGLTAPERNALEAAPAASSLESLVLTLARDGVARTEEALRAVFIGLSSGLIAAPGWPDRR